MGPFAAVLAAALHRPAMRAGFALALLLVPTRTLRAHSTHAVTNSNSENAEQNVKSLRFMPSPSQSPSPSGTHRTTPASRTRKRGSDLSAGATTVSVRHPPSVEEPSAHSRPSPMPQG